MQRLRSGRIHPILLLILGFGVCAGVYVRYSTYKAKEAERIADEEAKKNPRRRGLGNAAEFARTNAAPERKVPFKYLFSDTAPTNSTTNAAPVVDVKYSGTQVTPKSFSEESRKMMLEGVAHFRKTNSFNTKVIVGETADLMEDIVETLHTGLGSDLKRFREKLSPILIDPLVSGDPYFQYLAGLVHVETGETFAAEELFYGAVIDHTKYDYPSRYVVPVYNAALENGLERVIHAKIHERFADAIVCWLKYDFSETPEQHRIVWATLKQSIDLLNNDDKLDYIKKILDLNQKEPFASKWLALMINARYHALLAESGEAGSQDYQDHIAAAEKCLTDALELNSGFPDPLVELISLSGLADGTVHEPAFWVQKAEEMGFQEYGIYKAMLETCDSSEAMMDFGKTCAESAKFDTIIPFTLVGAYQRAQDDVTDPETVRLVAQCLGKLADDSTPKFVGKKKVAPEWFRSAQAVIAAKNGDHKMASDAFDSVGDKFVDTVVDAFPGVGSLTKAKARVDALANLPTEAIEKIEALYKRQRDGEDVTGELEKAIEETGQISAAAKGSNFLSSAKAFLETGKSYAAGESTQLPFGDNMVLWDSPVDNQLRSDTAGSIEIDTLGGENHASLMSTYYTPGSKTIEVDLEFLSKNNPCDAEIIFGGWRDYGSTGVITINGPGERVGFGSTAFNGNIAKFQLNGKPETMNIRANIADGFAEIFINNQLVVRSTSSRILASSEVGLGLNGYGTMRSKVKFSNLRVRKWDAVPPLNDSQALVKHYQKETESNPEDGYSWLFLGLAELDIAGSNDGQLSSAQSHIEKSVALGVPKLQAAPYLGEIADRKGDAEAARSQYLIAYDQLEEVPVEILQTGTPEQTYDRFQVSSARFLWNEMSHPDRDFEARNQYVEKFDAQAKLNTPIGSETTWINARLQALVRSTHAMAETTKLAEAKMDYEKAEETLDALKTKEGFDDSDEEEREAEGDDENEKPKEKSRALLAAEREERATKAKMAGLERSTERHQEAAVRAIESAISAGSLDTVDELEALKKAIESKSLYNRDTTLPPSYLGADGLKTFPILRDYLRPEWKEFYK